MARQVQEQEEAERAAAEAQAQAQAQAPDIPHETVGAPPAPAQTGTRVAAGDRPMRLKAVAMVLKLLDKKRADEVLSQFSPEVADELKKLAKTPRLEEQVDLRVAKQCLEDLKFILPKKKKLSQDNMIREMDKIFQTHQMEDVESIVKSERPFVKRFVSQSYEGDYYQGVPLRVAKILVSYMKDNLKQNEPPKNPEQPPEG